MSILNFPNFENRPKSPFDKLEKDYRIVVKLDITHKKDGIYEYYYMHFYVEKVIYYFMYIQEASNGAETRARNYDIIIHSENSRNNQTRPGANYLSKKEIIFEIKEQVDRDPDILILKQKLELFLTTEYMEKGDKLLNAIAIEKIMK